MTGADGAKINFNALEFADRPPANEEEIKLIEDINKWLTDKGGNLCASALKSHIPGSDLVELPLGSDHNEIKARFAAEHQGTPAASFSAAPQAKALKSAEDTAETTSEPPSAKGKKAIELTAEQAKTLGLDF